MPALHITTGRASALPLSLIGQAIPRLSRHDLEVLTERLIDRLDELDGEPDLEDDDPAEDGGEREIADWPTIGSQWELSQ